MAGVADPGGRATRLSSRLAPWLAAIAVAQLSLAPALRADRVVWSPARAPGATGAPAPSAAHRWLWYHGWTFSPKGPSTAFRPVTLPHVWPRDHDYAAGTYRATFTLTDRPPSLWLCFDAVAQVARIRVNGHDVGTHTGAFTPFSLDISGVAVPGDNQVEVAVQDESAVTAEDGDVAYSQLGMDRPGQGVSPAGIIGGVWLESRADVHADRIEVKTSTRERTLSVHAAIRNRSGSPAEATVSQAVYAWPNAGQAILILPTRKLGIATGEEAWLDVSLPWADAMWWSPEHPTLYVLRTTVTCDGHADTKETRFGFREFWVDGKQFRLNGVPTRLMGSSSSRDFRRDPATYREDGGRAFALETFRLLRKEFNARAYRLHASIYPPGVIEAADEAGILLIEQSGIWSAMKGSYDRGGARFLANTRDQFAEWFWRDCNRPSVVIWDVENEMIRGERPPERMTWVLALDDFIHRWDPDRVVEHSGAGWYSPTQQTIHIHMQEQFAAILSDWERAGTRPLICGEFWEGGRGEARLQDSFEPAGETSALQDQAERYRDKFLEMRYHGVAGIMPFRFGDDWLGPVRLDDSGHAALDWVAPSVGATGADALAPIAGFVWPRGRSAAAGERVERTVVVCNDRDEPLDAQVTCSWGSEHQSWHVTLAPGEFRRQPVTLVAAADGPIEIVVSDSAGRRLAGDRLDLHVLPVTPSAAGYLTRKVVVLPADQAPRLGPILAAMGIQAEPGHTWPEAASDTLVIVAPDTGAHALGRDARGATRYLAAGGRILCLDQSARPDWMPVALPFWSAVQAVGVDYHAIEPASATKDLIYSRTLPLYAPGHPVFAGLGPDDFKEWSPSDGRVCDDLFDRPAALGLRATGAWRALAGGTRRENVSIAEMRVGQGTAIFCQPQVASLGAPAAARQLLRNLLRYLDGPAWSAPESQVAFVGSVNPARIAGLTGLTADRIVPASALPADSAGGIVVAGDGATAQQIDALARAGRTVLVLSHSVAAALPGYRVEARSGVVYAGTRAHTVDSPLFWGVGTPSFLPLEASPARGALTHWPADARPLLGALAGPRGEVTAKRGLNPGGVEIMAAAGAIATAEPRGHGVVIATTLEPWNAGSETARALLAQLLANAGVELPADARGSGVVAIKRTPRLQLDGKLNDWTNDIEDRNVSPYRHADPVILSGGDDPDGSGVCYLLADDANLYLAGWLVGRAAPSVDFSLGSHHLVYAAANGSLRVDGATVPGAKVVPGRARAADMVDSRRLDLIRKDRRLGDLEAADDVVGRTFEAAIPWSALGGQPNGKTLPLTVHLHLGATDITSGALEAQLK